MGAIVEDIAALLHSLPDVEHEPVDEQTAQAVAQLARLLSDTVGEASEDELVCNIRKTGVIGPIVRLISSHREDTQLLYLGLSILVNLADTGGADVVTMHRGTDLLLELLHSSDDNAVYYAVAGVQNLSSLPECVHLLLDSRSDERLRELLLAGAGTNEHILRCAAGALSNIRNSPQYEARLAAEERARAHQSAGKARQSKGWQPRKWSPRSEASLQKALAARVQADAMSFAMRWRGAVVIQAAARRRLGLRAAHALRWRERPSDAWSFGEGSAEAEAEGALAEELEAQLEAIATRLRTACDVSSETKEAVSELAHVLSEVSDAECAPLLRALARLDVVRRLVRLLSTVERGAHTHLVHIGLSALVNVADIGGALLVKRDGGLDLLLRLLHSPADADEAVVFLATAGVQNVLSTPQMANDSDCMQKLVRCDAEAVLQRLAGHANPSVSRSAEGALANLAGSRVHKLLKSALQVTEHYRSQAELDLRTQSRSGTSSGAGSCDGSPRSNTSEQQNRFVYEVV